MRKSIGLLTTCVGGPLKSYENAVTRAVGEVAGERNFRLVIYSGGAPSQAKGFESMRNYIFKLLSDRVVDGVFILSASLSLYVSAEEYRSFFQQFNPFPMVSIGLIAPGLHGVIIDNRRLMREMTEHLITVHNIRAPLFVGGPAGNHEAKDRLQGFREAMALSGLSVQSRMILEGTFLRESGYRLMREYLRTQNPPFDGVICANDEMAVGVRDYLAEKGLHAPRDYLITGFDDLEVAALTEPPLTTVNQPVYAMARKACSLLCDNIEHGTVIENFVYPIKLVIRESCGCPVKSTRIADDSYSERINADMPLPNIFSELLPQMGDDNRRFVQQGFEKIVAMLSGLSSKTACAECLDILQSLLSQSKSRIIDVSIWYAAITLLESRMTGNAAIPSRFWEEARFLIWDAEKIGVHRERIMSERLESLLRTIGEDLINTYRIDDLRSVLDYHLNSLGVSALHVLVFDRIPFSLERLHPLLRWDHEGGAVLTQSEASFLSGDILPGGVLAGCRGVPVIEALTFRDEIFGVLVLDCDDPDGTVCNSLREMIGGALKNIDFWSEASERTRFLEILNQTEKSLSAWPEEERAIEIVMRGIYSWLHNPWSMVWLCDKSGELLRAKMVLHNGVREVVFERSVMPLDEAIRVGSFSLREFRGVRIPVLYQDKIEGVIEIGFSGEKPFVFNESVVKNLGLFVDQLALALSNARLYRETIQSAEHIQKLNLDLALKLRRITSLRAIDVAITGTSPDGEIYGTLLEQIQRELGSDAVSLLLYNPESNVLLFAASRGFLTDALRFTHLTMGKGMAGRAALERKQLFIEDVTLNPETLAQAPLLHNEGFRAYCAAPLLSRGELKGVLELFHRSPLHPDKEWSDFLEMLTGQAAIALDHSALIAGLQQANTELVAAYDATIEGWSRALDLRDHETEGHSKRVALESEALGRVLGLNNDSLLHLYRGALLHDIGKVAIPDSILLKPGRLTDEETVIMKKHPEYARQILTPIQFLRPALTVPGDHHEKWDGSGYPRGLRGEEIPLFARIFALVDVWDALICGRPYREAWSEQMTAEHIHSLSGIHFDPSITPVFLKLKGFSFLS